MIKASRAEQGFLGYSYGEVVLETGLIHGKELWQDPAALDRHFTSYHIPAWRKAWAGLGISDRDLRVYEVDRPEARKAC